MVTHVHRLSIAARLLTGCAILLGAAAVFHFQHGRWGTGGRVLMNMNPSEAVTRLAGQFAAVSSSLS